MTQSNRADPPPSINDGGHFCFCGMLLGTVEHPPHPTRTRCRRCAVEHERARKRASRERVAARRREAVAQ